MYVSFGKFSFSVVDLKENFFFVVGVIDVNCLVGVKGVYWCFMYIVFSMGLFV